MMTNNKKSFIFIFSIQNGDLDFAACLLNFPLMIE